MTDKHTTIDSVEDLQAFAIKEVARVSPLDTLKKASPDGIDLSVTTGAVARVSNTQEQKTDELVEKIRTIREKFDSNRKVWKELLEEIRLLRMATTTEVETMSKSVERLLHHAGEVDALSAALTKLADVLKRPELERFFQ